MPQCCAVPKCGNKTGGHRFPLKDETRLKQWIVAIRRSFTPSKHSLVCKRHFTPDDYELPKDSVLQNPRPVLKKNAVPSKFSWNEPTSNLPRRRNQRRSARNERKNSVPEQNSLDKKHEGERKEIFPMDYVEVEIEPIPRLKPTVVPSRFTWNRQNDERKEIKRKRVVKPLQPQKTELQETATIKKEEKESEEDSNIEETCVKVEIEKLNTDNAVQCSLCKCSNSSNDTADVSEHESNKKSTTIFRIDNLKDRADVVQFYTGFDNYNHFMYVFNLFGDEVNSLKYYPSMSPISPQPATVKHALTPSDQFYLTLIKLRRNMCNKELSFHFEIIQSCVNDYFVTWINYLYRKFKELNVQALKETVNENVKHRRQNDTCTIIDCSETESEKPQGTQRATCSKKSANTLKVLVGISGSGCVNFVSNAYEGSVSDKELFDKCGITNLPQKGGSSLGDCGSKIQDPLSIKDVSENMPQVLEKGSNPQDPLSHTDITGNMPQILEKISNQLEAHQAGKSKQLSSERINVERVTGLGKTFKILSNKLSSNLEALRGRIIFVCFMLASFQRNYK